MRLMNLSCMIKLGRGVLFANFIDNSIITNQPRKPLTFQLIGNISVREDYQKHTGIMQTLGYQ